MTANTAVAIFGGTFDPIHFGHLRSALELIDCLPIAELRFMPVSEPPHRDPPQAAAEDRARMLECAIRAEPKLVCDRRELLRPGPSYSVDSLRSLRAELGPERPLALVIGSDALPGIRSWHRWEELLDLAHLLVLARPGWTLPDDRDLAALLATCVAPADALLARPAGALIPCQLRPLDISATAIRALLQSGRSARYLLPDSVLDYIAERGLYGSSSAQMMNGPPSAKVTE